MNKVEIDMPADKVELYEKLVATNPNVEWKGGHLAQDLDPRRAKSRAAALAEAKLWVEGFVGWYSTEHRHSGIRFVTPDHRHDGREREMGLR